jgi:ATP-dependent RNA helicase SUPV3L1/SUV3
VKRRPRRRRWPPSSRRAPSVSAFRPTATSRSVGRHPALDRRAGRHADFGRGPLKPRVILLGRRAAFRAMPATRSQARAERFVGYQIETVAEAADRPESRRTASGIARGIAFRSGRKFRPAVPARHRRRRQVARPGRPRRAAPARRALRRLSCLHAGAAQARPGRAWSRCSGRCKNDGKDKPGFGDIVPSLAAGRTSSWSTSPSSRNFYKLAGFRILGRRAVRVDILERLADLIRPALPGAPAPARVPTAPMTAPPSWSRRP